VDSQDKELEINLHLGEIKANAKKMPHKRDYGEIREVLLSITYCGIEINFNKK